MISWTRYMINLRPCTKQVKNDTEQEWKQKYSRCLKIHFGLTFLKQKWIISSQSSTNQLQTLEKVESLAYVFNFRYRFIARHPPPLYCEWFLSIDNSVRRLLVLKLVLYSLLDDAIDGLRTNSANADPFWLVSGCGIFIKNTFFRSGPDNFLSEVNTRAYICPAC